MPASPLRAATSCRSASLASTFACMISLSRSSGIVKQLEGRHENRVGREGGKEGGRGGEGGEMREDGKKSGRGSGGGRGRGRG